MIFRMTLLDPAGLIALKERDLMITATLVMLIIVIPVFVLTIWFAIRYRENNHKAKYTPNWDRNRGLEFIWWGVPIAIVVALSILAWTSSHQLDPYKPIDSNIKPITIEVVALDWKWLFIYPDQKIASVNLVEFPANTPVNFEITSDTVMNSFWIPSLSGQIYAMPAMSTQLHVIANKLGSFDGSSANISGKGFSGMTFKANSVSEADFDDWVATIQQSPVLDQASYAQLAKPSQNNPVSYYSLANIDMYNQIINKYMSSSSPMPEMDMTNMPGMNQ